MGLNLAGQFERDLTAGSRLCAALLLCALSALAVAGDRPGSAATQAHAATSPKGAAVVVLPYVFHDGFDEITLEFTSPASASFLVGENDSFAITTNAPAQLELLGSLPPGLNFDSATGLLAGTPAPASGGAHPLQITARNEASGRRVQRLTLTVNEAPTLGSPGAASCEAESPCSFSLSASGYPSPSYALPGLPAGLTLDPASGAVTGTPASGSGGFLALTATASNAAGEDAQPFILTINESPAFTSAPDTTCNVGSECTFSLSANGYPAPVYALPGLPTGLILDPVTGVIGGTPAAGTGGVLALTAGASNDAGADSQPISLTIYESPTFTSGLSASCILGSPCSFALSASGHPEPQYALPGLPSGLLLDPVTGVVSGTPDGGSGGAFSLTATASNTQGQDSQPFNLAINTAPAITSSDSLDCNAGETCSFQFAADGFPASQFSLPGLPAGLTLNADTGALSGAPDIGTQGVYALTLSADNGIAPTATQAFTLTIAPATLKITAVSPAVLAPGIQAQLTGVLFDPVPANNTVTIDGVTVDVLAASTTSLTVTVPCITSGTLPLRVQVGADISPDFLHPLQGNRHALEVGESVVVTDPAQVACTELEATNEASRYVVTVFSADPSPASNAPFRLYADGLQDFGASASHAQAQAMPQDVVQRASATVSPAEAAAEAADRAHQRILEQNEREYARLFEQFQHDPRMHADPGVIRGGTVEPPVNRTFRISNLAPPAGQTICSSYYVVAATRVYYDGTIAIYEDDATPAAFRAANSPTMALNYQRIGDQFKDDMEPIVRENFGDILRRDAITDNNGALVALFTPHINNNVPGVAGFVVSCDQFPNDDSAAPAVGGPYTTTGGSNGASNFGEFFYAYQPVVDAAGYTSGNTPQQWYRTIRSTFIHESKHVASQAARVANGAPTFESSWLEEGTARHSEELWMREAVDFQPWLSNVPYGSGANPINIYCDVRPGFAECDANPRRPASIMQRHFTSMYTHLFGANARLLSPFGATSSDNASYFYAISWSLVRYAVDRYGTSDAEFLTALTQSGTSGVTNLTERAGVPLDELLGGWALSLVTDDYPGLAVPNPDIEMPTWNFRSIYAGLNADFPTTYTRPYPQEPAQFGFGSFTAGDITTLRGGGALWYELSGTQTQAQLLKLSGSGGGTPVPASVRVGVARVQ